MEFLNRFLIAQLVEKCYYGGSTHLSLHLDSFISLSHIQRAKGEGTPPNRAPSMHLLLGGAITQTPILPCPSKVSSLLLGRFRGGNERWGARRRIEVPLNHSGSYFVADY